MPLLRPYKPHEFSVQDEAVFESLVRRDHWVRRADDLVDFVALRQSIEHLYSTETGAPCEEPILLIKLELLLYHDRLSDGNLWKRVETDMAYRWFLGLGLGDHLPDKSTLSYFRSRLKAEGFATLFDDLLRQLREQGLVRDRLRIKDATHVIADIAVPAGLTLVAQARNRLLNAAEPFDAERVAGERVRIETVRKSTSSQADAARLLSRIEHLRDILSWANDLAEPAVKEANSTWKTLVAARDIATKTLAGHDRPDAGDKLRSVSDPDARRGRHGEFYDGYFVDVMIDADSELFTAVNVLPASGNESADALTLIEHEQKSHGNTIESLSIDGAGFDGPTLRKLEDTHNIDVYVPPKQTSASNRFGPEDFTVSDDGAHVTCPAGETSQYRQRDENRHATVFRFKKSACDTCKLFAECIGRTQKHGRSVQINDYSAEHKRVRDRAQTEEYEKIKKEHPKVERKLGHLVNRYGARRARYRGHDQVKGQQLMAAFTSNVDRMMRLLDDQSSFVFG